MSRFSFFLPLPNPVTHPKSRPFLFFPPVFWAYNGKRKEGKENMDIKLRLDANKIYHKEFTGTKPGYDSLQVDTFLDIVIKDYESFETYLKESTKEIESLQNKIDLLKSTLQEMQTENASLKNKLSGIAKNADAAINNLELLKRISALEKALSKAGINPNAIN